MNLPALIASHPLLAVGAATLAILLVVAAAKRITRAARKVVYLAITLNTLGLTLPLPFLTQ